MDITGTKLYGDIIADVVIYMGVITKNGIFLSTECSTSCNMQESHVDTRNVHKCP